MDARRRWWRPALQWGWVLGIAIALGACSGSTEGRDDPTDSAAGSLKLVSRGLAAGDGPRVCSLLYGEAQLSLQRATKASNCVDAVIKFERSIDRRTRDVLLNFTPGRVDTKGDGATISGPGVETIANALGVEAPLTLSPFQGDWMIQDSSKTPDTKKRMPQ